MKNITQFTSIIFTKIYLSIRLKNLVIFTAFLISFNSAQLQVIAQSNKSVDKTVKEIKNHKLQKSQSKSEKSSLEDSTSKKSTKRNSSLTGNVFYAAPDGLPTGNGSINNPWNLKTALSHPATVQPGDTIYLRGGTYNVPLIDLGFRSTLTGTAENPIKVMSYPGEWAVIDGNVSFSTIKSKVLFRIDGDYTWFMNFEITNTEPGTRKISISGSHPPERRANGVEDAAMGTKLINLIIHDAGQGISAANNYNGSEYYGNVVYNNGWDAPDSLHGHNNYVQNATGTKNFEENFFFNAFKFNSQMYGSSASASRNFTWIGNVFFNGGMAWWGPNIENLIARENFTYKNVFKVGNSVDSRNISATIENNYLMNGVFLDVLTENITFRNNTVWHNANDPLLTINSKSFWDPSKVSVDNNTYYKNTSNKYFRLYYGQKSREFTFNRTDDPTRFAQVKKSWQQDLELDQNSTFINSVPTGIKIFIRPNRYASGRANIIVYNWSQAQTVNLDVSSILNPGDTYELRNVQDYFGDVITGTYTGEEISVDMINRTRAKPIGYDQVSTWYHDPLKPNTFPEFGAFVLIKTSN